MPNSHNISQPCNLAKAACFIFDLDGTLYDQRQLRSRMLVSLVFRLLTFQLSLFELKIIKCFRDEREKRKGLQGKHLEDDQYQWCARALNITPQKVEATIQRWMHQFPMKHLSSARYKHTEQFFEALNRLGKKIVIYSDYPVEPKMKALNLASDAGFCSTTPPLQQLKPSAGNLHTICKQLQLTPDECVYIGDRDDTDGQGARDAGIPFILVDIEAARKGKFYQQLTQELELAHEKQ